jgi:hypothetical protein
MPLSPPADREPIHERHVECRGYRRKDGLWDIEGHMVDVKTYDFHNAERGMVEAGVPVHEMWVRITIDDDYLIHAAEASTEYAPYGICPRAAPPMEKLKGVRIGPGWRREINKRVGGTLGCTHLRELLGPMATAAVQTLAPLKEKEDAPARDRRPTFLGTCLAYAPDSPVVQRRWPEWYRDNGEREE